MRSIADIAQCFRIKSSARPATFTPKMKKKTKKTTRERRRGFYARRRTVEHIEMITLKSKA